MSDTVEVKASLDGGGGYDWDAVEVGVDAHGGTWVRSGAGCSCNDISMEEWVPFHKLSDDVLAQAVADWSGSHGSDSANDVTMRATFMREVRDAWREAKKIRKANK